MVNNTSVIGEGDVTIPVGYSQRAKAAASNPVATTLEYKNLIDNLLNILVGVEQNKDKKRSQYFMQSKKGVFGYMNAALGVNEVQARLVLHFHLIMFGGLHPRLLQTVASFSDICKEISSVLNTIYTVELPRKVHIADLVKKQLPRKNMKYTPPLLEI